MIKTNLLPPSVATNPSASVAGDIRGIKQPVPIPNVWLWVGIVAAGLSLALLAWWAWRKRRARPVAAETRIIIPPHQKARAQLEQALALLDQPRPFCILVSDTIRVYLEERFDLRAPERTTEEFLEELQRSPLLTYEQKCTLGEFLTGCDLVKFARYEPATRELQGIYDTAVRLVNETEPPPVLTSQAGPPMVTPPSP
jgi:hypothetical protein